MPERDMADSIDNISTDATKPKSATTAAGSASQHSLKERLEVERYKAEQSVVSAGRLPIQVGRFIPGSTV